MKRMIAWTAAIVVLLSLSNIAFAESSAQASDSGGFLFADRFLEYVNGINKRFAEGDYRLTNDLTEINQYELTAYYDELYYHRDENGEADWALIFGVTVREESESLSRYGDYLAASGYWYPFLSGLALYDVNKDRFFGISNDPYWIDEPEFDWREYEGFTEGLESLMKMPRSRTLTYFRRAGDLDADGELTILDATYIQRKLAGMEHIFNDPGRFSEDAVADFDADGEVAILDATAIQRKLAGIV